MTPAVLRRLMTPSDLRTCIGGAGILGAIAAGMTAQGCSVLSDPCGSVLPVVTTTQAQLADVQRAISEVEQSGIRDVVPEAHRTKFDDALADVRHGYSIAVQSLALAADACSEPDLRGALKLIVDGWEVVRSFVALVGGEGTPWIADPLVYTGARGASR